MPHAALSLRFLALALAAGCSQSHVTGFREIGRFHAPNTHTLYPDVTYFVVAPDSVLSDRNAVLGYSHDVCAEDLQVCLVLFWTDQGRAAASFPIEDREAEAIMASYNRNRSTGSEGFLCYNFGSSEESCRKRE